MAARDISKLIIADVYPCLVAKAVRKGRSKAEVDEVIFWLTGYDDSGLSEKIEERVDLGRFFGDAPMLNPKRKMITGSICGVRVEEITDPLTQNVRYLDKLVDELAKGKPIEKILRK